MSTSTCQLARATIADVVSVRSDAERAQRRTKIICTMGPACWEKDQLVQMIDAGMDVARFNFSHGDHESHKKVLVNLRAAVAERPGKKVALMLDTKGPEIRTGMLQDAYKKTGIELVKGQELKIVTDYTFLGDNTTIACSYDKLPQSVKPGNIILMADGSVSCQVTEVGADFVKTCVVNNAKIGERKNMNLPGVKVDLPVCGERETNDFLNFGIPNQMHYLAISFVQCAEDLHQVRRVLGERGKHFKLIPKIENYEGCLNFDEILEACDGVMVARGDLGMEIPLEKVFIAQKMMVSKCNQAGKPVIVATQMLESMIAAPRPTRAEASDVANAVLDGCDCVMLSGESANGAFPCNAVDVLSRVSLEAEMCLDYQALFTALRASAKRPVTIPEAVCAGAVEAAQDTDAKLILVLTETGHTARLVAKYRPSQMILALTASDMVASEMSYLRGVVPVQVESFQGTESVIKKGLVAAKERGLVQSGDVVVAVHGIMEEVAGHTNLMKVVVAP